MTLRIRAVSAAAACAALLLSAAPAAAQFYKDKTLTLLVNYGAGGNADTEARVLQHYLPQYIPGHPNVIIQNAPGAGGITAVNLLGLGIGTRPDGYTMSYFTISATDLIVDNPALKTPIVDFQIVAGARGWNIAYGRKDIQPGMTKPADIGKAKNVFAGGYAKTSSHDTRLRLSLEVLGVPYRMVTGFPATADINKAMIQGEVNFSGSSLPGYQTQVIPQVIQPGIGMPFWQFPVKGPDGKPVGNPELTKAGILTFDQVYRQAFGKDPSGPKNDALLMMNDIGTKLQRGLMFHKAVPKEAVEIMRKAVEEVARDPGFRADYQRVTGQEPDFVGAAELEPLFERVRHLDPVIKKTLQDSVDQ
jgi:hypothetical protein